METRSYDELLDNITDYLTDPVSGSNSKGQSVSGAVCLHVDDLFMAGNQHFSLSILSGLRRAFQIGHEDKNDMEFVGMITAIFIIMQGK